jgi:hypothetical protein
VRDFGVAQELEMGKRLHGAGQSSRAATAMSAVM